MVSTPGRYSFNDHPDKTAELVPARFRSAAVLERIGFQGPSRKHSSASGLPAFRSARPRWFRQRCILGSRRRPCAAILGLVESLLE